MRYAAGPDNMHYGYVVPTNGGTVVCIWNWVTLVFVRIHFTFDVLKGRVPPLPPMKSLRESSCDDYTQHQQIFFRRWTR